SGHRRPIPPQTVVHLEPVRQFLGALAGARRLLLMAIGLDTPPDFLADPARVWNPIKAKFTLAGRGLQRHIAKIEQVVERAGDSHLDVFDLSQERRTALFGEEERFLLDV